MPCGVGMRKAKGSAMTLQIGILLGDDIGLEVVPETIKVMRAAAKKTSSGSKSFPKPSR